MSKIETKEIKKDKSVDVADKSIKTAAASAALKAAVNAQSAIDSKNADRDYLIAKKKNMLNKAKKDTPIEFVGQKIYKQYLGSPYTFLYNTIPVTVVFDGSTQKLPKFIYDHLQSKLAKINDANEYKSDMEVRKESI